MTGGNPVLESIRLRSACVSAFLLFATASWASSAFAVEIAPGLSCDDDVTASVRVNERGSWKARRYPEKAKVFFPEKCGATPSTTRPQLGLGCETTIRLSIDYLYRTGYRSNWLEGKVGDVIPGACPNREPAGGTTLRLSNAGRPQLRLGH